ncbi:MAG: Rab GTPase ypt31 [Paramarteilia canceri]
MDQVYNVKVVFLGDASVGKSSLLYRMVEKEFPSFSEATIGQQYLYRFFEMDNKTYKINIWDTGGSERFDSLTSNYLRKVDCIFFVYDICDRKSFERLDEIYTQYKANFQFEPTITILANKIDKKSERVIKFYESLDLAENFKALHFQTSALTNASVERAFKETMAIVISTKDKKNDWNQLNNSLLSSENNEKNCC